MKRSSVNWREASHAAAVRHGIERPDLFVAQIEVESDDFDLEEAYLAWKKAETPALSQMMLAIIQAKPELAKWR